MTHEDRELLLEDFCARLPYGVKVAFFNEDLTHHSESKTLIGIECINNLNYSSLEDEDGNTTIIEFVKPYLFPLSSMTEEQFIELKVFADLTDELELVEWNDNYKTLEFWLEEIPSYCVIKVFDWLNRNHFDYRELIEKGLAIDATDKDIY